jgi:alkylation response protein AidB-like acyl-CoA dehydrogenase
VARSGGGAGWRGQVQYFAIVADLQAEARAAGPWCPFIPAEWGGMGALQIHGALGYTLDTPLAAWYAEVRMQHLVDGPDEVHRWRIGRNVLAAQRTSGPPPGRRAATCSEPRFVSRGF